MKIEVREANPDRLWPECYPLLHQLPETQTHQHEWGTRAPAGIFATAISPLHRRFSAVLEKLCVLQEKGFTGTAATQDAVTDLLDAHESSLYSLNEYLEDCLTISKVLFSKSDDLKRISAWRAFASELKSLRDPIDRRVNATKHRQARLGFVMARNRMLSLPGYCIQGIVAPGTIGPDPNIHPHHRGSPSATSFSYELRRCFLLIYAAGFHLNRLLRTKSNVVAISPVKDSCE